MNIILVFYKNGEFDRLNEKLGIGFPIDKLNSDQVEYIYIAINDTDADRMIDLKIEERAAVEKSKDNIIKELANRLIETLDDSVPATDADAIVADVAKEIYNDVLGIKGNVVIDKDQPVGRVHGGFGPNGKKATAIIAKYKFEEIKE